MKALFRLAEFLCARALFQRRVRRCLTVVLILLAISIQLSLIASLLRTPTKYVRDFSSSSTWKTIRDVVDISRSLRFPIFALDAEAIQYRGTSGSACVHFCSGQIFQFGTISTFSNKRESQFCERLVAMGFEVEVVRVPNPKMVELVVDATAHYLIRRSTKNPPSSVLIHVVVFHDRPDNYWWHSALPKQHALRDLEDKLQFTLTTGAHPKVEILASHLDHIRLFMPTQRFTPSLEFIDCNRTSAEAYFSRTGGRDSTPNAELFRIRVRKLLFKVRTLLAKHNIPFWLSSGTCLGWFRQCDVIPYTTDVDIGIFIEDYKPVLIEEFSTHDLALTHIFGRVNDSYELSFLDVIEQIKLDIFFFYRESNQTWNGGTQARTGHKYKYIFRPFNMCLTDFLDILVQVPCPPLPYIEANYGTDWKIPIKHWDWKKSPPNVVENGIWPVEEWNQLIQLFPLPPY